MGGPYNIPRNYKGEGKILFIFSTKALLYSVIGAIAGLLFYYIFRMLNMTIVGVIIVIIFAVIGFSIATFKIPDNTSFAITKKVGGENIDKIIMRWIKFKRNKNKIYIYKEDKTNEQ